MDVGCSQENLCTLPGYGVTCGKSHGAFGLAANQGLRSKVMGKENMLCAPNVCKMLHIFYFIQPLHTLRLILTMAVLQLGFKSGFSFFFFYLRESETNRAPIQLFTP